MSLQRRRLPKVKLRDVLEITFYDHVASVGGISEPLLCRVIGELVDHDKQAYYLASWLTESSDVSDLDSHTILKSTVKSISIIRRH